MFPELAAHTASSRRGGVAAAPDVILTSWCGKKAAPARIAARLGWDAGPAA